MRNYLLFALLLSSSVLCAQNSVDVDNRTLSPSIQRHLLPEASTKKLAYDAYYDKLIEEYKQRMRDNVKKYKSLAKEMEKPQYSDFSYFGHKRKPKKRPVGKRKFCMECEIVH